MRMFKKEEPLVLNRVVVEPPTQEKFRLQPTFEEVAHFAQMYKLHSSTEKLREAYRLCRKERLLQALALNPHDQIAILKEIVDLL